MQPYRDIDGDSAVVAYEVGGDFIRVEFDGGRVYLYTEQSAGSGHIAQMKLLAARGNGLGAYISKHVRKGYSRRER